MGRRPKQLFLQTQANKHMKRRSSLITKGVQIKTTMRYHFTPVRMAIIKMSTNNKCWIGCGKKGNPLALLVGMRINHVNLKRAKRTKYRLGVFLMT